MALHVQRGDMVEVITGDDRSTPGRRTIARVLRVLPKERKVIVEGVNRVYKHVRPSRRNPQGGRLSKEMPIDISNVLRYCDRCGRGVRVGYRFRSDGTKERYCKKCSSSLGPVPTQAKPRQD